MDAGRSTNNNTNNKQNKKQKQPTKVFRQVFLHMKSKAPQPERRLAYAVDGGFTGNKTALRQSSSYTKTMGAAVALSFMGYPASAILQILG